MSMPWIEIVCKACGATDEVMRLSKCGKTGLCWRCQMVADGIRDVAGNWLGKYARLPDETGSRSRLASNGN